MSKISGLKCDFCGELFYQGSAQKAAPITIPDIKIGQTTYRLNDGHICSKCEIRLSEVLEPVREKAEAAPERDIAERPPGV